ncbi:MAG: hypothetical protein J7J98_04740 [candidate division Zixibacteria bacterium]|nr:hypothetical protein [candidate division Zixibacteria bacterium]
MKQIVDKLILGSQVAVVVLALLALVVSGAGAAARLFDDPGTPAEILERPQNVTLDHKTDPKEAPGEMATDGRPWTEQSACLQITLIILGDTPQTRLWTDPGSTAVSVCSHSAWDRSNQVSTSPTLVDHRLGHRFTLVGLKPSGTS